MKHIISTVVAVYASTLLSETPVFAQAKEYLPICIKCLNPRITAKTGFGTENAVAEAKVIAEDAKVWCAANKPRDPYCPTEEVKNGGDGARKSFRATANCMAGQMNALNSGDYIYKGLWTEGPGLGKPRIADFKGNVPRWESIVSGTGKPRAEWDLNGGYSLSGQWTALCGTVVPTAAAAKPAPPSQQMTAQRPTAAQTAVTSPSVCPGQDRCAEVNAFAATMTDFRTSNVGRGTKVVTMSIRFQNKMNRPIILGYVAGSGVTTDDQGNRYVVTPESVRGIGGIANGQVDPKFVLRPGETGDARFEMVWGWNGRDIFGLNFVTELTVRELRPTPSGQFRLGEEFPLRYQGLSNRAVVSSTQQQQPGVAVAHAAQSNPEPVMQQQVAVPAAGPDPCIGVPRCYNAGPFLAEIQNISSSIAGGRHHVLRFNIRFRSLVNQPIILANTYNSSVAVDNQGNRYGITPDQAVTGMGVVSRTNADPQFVLQPGQTRNATFQVYRRNTGANPPGISYALDFSLEQLEVLESRQIRSTRQFTLNFTNLGVSTSAGGNMAAPGTTDMNDAGKKIIDVFRKKK